MKNVIIGTALTTLSMFILSGCGEEKPKTIAYYKAHLDEAKEVRVECKAKEKNGAFEGQNQSSPTGELLNCQNAMHVVMRIKHRPILGDEPVQKTW